MSIKKNYIVSDVELNTIYQQMLDKSQATSLNAYDIYIQECKQRRCEKSPQAASSGFPGSSNVYLEKHHIIPRFDNGSDSPENIVYLTVKEHVIAHWLRWKVLNKPQDYRAFLFRIGDIEEALI